MKKTVVLITPPSHSHRTAEENLGVGYLASVLREVGNSVIVIDAWLLDIGIREIVSRIKSAGTIDLIGVSCYISSRSDVAELIQALRKEGVGAPIVAGGYGPTFYPAEFLSIGCDYVLRGEAERSMVDLLGAISGRSRSITMVEGLVRKSDGNKVIEHQRSAQVRNLDALPFPGRDSIQATIALKNPVHISTSRGCTAHCLFCSVVSFDRTMRQTEPWRSRSIPNIVEEIHRLYDEFGVTCYKIVDDSFIEPPRDVQWAEDFASELKKRNLKISFRTQVRADRLNPDLVAVLAGAGWFATSIGVENASPTALRRMNKSAKPSDNLNALAMLAQHKIYVQMGLILFDPFTTMAELRENLSFLSSLSWPVTKGIFTEMYAAEGTPFTQLLGNQGRILRSKFGNYEYRREHDQAEKVYGALRAWHRSHSEIYDHAINPISAPKVLPAAGYAEYHGICLQLLKLDVDFFGETLAAVDRSDNAINDFAVDRIRVSTPVYDRIRQSIVLLDAKYGLSYSAQANKFL